MAFLTNVYVIAPKNEEDRCIHKIGYTYDIPARLTALKKKHGFECELIRSFEMDQDRAFMVERVSHSVLSDKLVGGDFGLEWFHISEEEAIQTVERTIEKTSSFKNKKEWDKSMGKKKKASPKCFRFYPGIYETSQKLAEMRGIAVKELLEDVLIAEFERLGLEMITVGED